MKRFSGRVLAYGLSILASIGLLGFYVANNTVAVSAQGVNTIYVTPASGSYGVGSTFTVSIRENSGSAVNAVQSDLGYSTNLQFVAIDASGGAFGIDASSTGGNGAVSIARGTTTPVSGDQLVARVTFKVLSAGTGSITMQSSSVVLSSSTNTDVVSTRNGASFSLTATGTPPVAPTPTPPAPSAGNTRRATNLATNSIAPQGTAQAAPLPGDTSVELSAPATIVTTPDAGRPVTKVEYLINDKVVFTDVEAPYAHSIDSTKYRNGTYTLTTKTYYQDGKIDVNNTSLIVKNKFDMNQLWLQLRHYAWLVVIVLIVIAELLYLKLFRKRGRGSGGGQPTVGPSGMGSGPVGGNPGSNSAMGSGPLASVQGPVTPSASVAPRPAAQFTSPDPTPPAGPVVAGGAGAPTVIRPNQGNQ